jgi:hypothetical protein
MDEFVSPATSHRELKAHREYYIDFNPFLTVNVQYKHREQLICKNLKNPSVKR